MDIHFIQLQEPVPLQEVDIPEAPPLIPAVIASDIVKEAELVPKNRGVEFEGPESDGRTILTAFSDALKAVESRKR